MNKPPVISDSFRSHKNHSAIFLFSGWILLLLTISFIAPWVPTCGFRRLTGIPCPFCGGTRCLIAFSHFKWVQAFQWNPMIFLICLGISLQLIARGKIFTSLFSTRFTWVIWTALIMNWIYLYWSRR